jgi:hypothetical protein
MYLPSLKKVGKGWEEVDGGGADTVAGERQSSIAVQCPSGSGQKCESIVIIRVKRQYRLGTIVNCLPVELSYRLIGFI